jgi:hypothetical protein
MEIADTDPVPTGMPVVPMAQVPPLNLPDYASMSPQEQAQHRATFRTRFGILRNAWPSYNIPDLPETTSLEEIHAQYDIYVRHIHISQEVDKYKIYIVIMFLLIELFLTKIGLNIGGYTVAQMRSMNKYERLLIELGETNYRSAGVAGAEGGAQSQWPVEFRLFFMALVNAVTFIVIKMLANYIGEGMANTVVDALSSYLSGAPPQPGQVLFGSSTNAGPVAATSTGVQPGGPPLPESNNPFGGLDIASLLANFGSMFINGQRPAPPGVPATIGAPAAPVRAPTSQGGAGTPRFLPAYNE